MNLSTILGFISLVGWVMVIAGAAMAISNAAQRRSGRPGVLLAVAGLVVGIIFFAASLGLILVGPTEVGVVFQSVGGDPSTNSLWPTPLGPGVHIIVPVINQTFIYTTEVQNYTMSKTAAEGAKYGDDSVQALTKDGQQVSFDVSVLFSVDPTKANLIHLKFQDRYIDDFVRPTVRSIIRDVLSGYNVEQLYGLARTEITGKIFDAAAAKFPDAGLTLKDLLVRNITFSDEFIKAVEQKQVALQQAEQANQEAARVRTLAQGQADAAVTTAKGASDATVARAQGDAQAIELRAAADAKALALINEQISKNPLLLQWRYIDKLAQNISMVLIPSNSPYLFDIQSMMAQAGKASAANAQPPAASTPEPTATPQPATTP
jgi:prohibitin 2